MFLLIISHAHNTNNKYDHNNNNPQISKQAKLFMDHSQQIIKRANAVWEKAIKIGDGHLWLYFIFAICQWLPTNHRLFYQDKSPFQRDRCQLCLNGSTKTSNTQC